MSEKLIRIVDTKTGEAKYRPAHVANDAKLLKRYGFIVQDFKEEKEAYFNAAFDNATKAMEAAVSRANEKVFGQLAEELKAEPTLEELKAEYETLTGKKAGNKKAETIASEILELKKQS